MPHIVKISQRRKGSGAQVRFQSRSFIDSDTSEKVDGTRRIQWTAWIGFGGRHASDSVDGMDRIRWTACVGLRRKVHLRTSFMC
jgi:hypothetical protein